MYLHFDCIWFSALALNGLHSLLGINYKTKVSTHMYVLFCKPIYPLINDVFLRPVYKTKFVLLLWLVDFNPQTSQPSLKKRDLTLITHFRRNSET